MRRKTSLLGATLLALVAASAVPLAAQTGKVYHYVQTGTDGSQPTDLWVYFEKDRTEQLGLSQGSERGTLSVQNLNGESVDLWEVYPEGKALFARVESTGPGQARVEVFPLGRPAETVARPSVPWTFYHSFAALAPVFRQKAGSQESFEVSLATPMFAPGQPAIRFDGPFTVSFAGEEERGVTAHQNP
jgi:hypothetical protein